MARYPEELDFSDAPEFGRREGLERALGILHINRGPNPVTIVETGTTRGKLGGGIRGDGWATLAWGWYCKKYGGRTYTIDRNPSAIDNCRKITVQFSECIEYRLGESCAEIAAIRWPIDLLYLDSGDDPALILRELEAAFGRLAPASVVTIDDTKIVGDHFEGKGALAGKKLVEEGFRLEFGMEPSDTPQVIFNRCSICPERYLS